MPSRVRNFSFAQIFGALVFVSVAALAVFLISRSSEDENSKKDKSEGPPAPLVDKGAPKELDVEIYPVVGATDARPVSLVFASDPAVCSKTKTSLGSRSHVLCCGDPPASAQNKMKKALAYLKKTYPRHVAGPPSALVADPMRAELGWRLALAEPGFFSRLYLPGLERKVLTATTLSALTKGEAKLLLISGASDERLDFLATVAGRRGLKVEAVGQGPPALDLALQRIHESDPRLAAQAAEPTKNKK